MKNNTTFKHSRLRNRQLKSKKNADSSLTPKEKMFLGLLNDIGTSRALQLISDYSAREESKQLIQNDKVQEDPRIQELLVRVVAIENLLQERQKNESHGKGQAQRQLPKEEELEVFHLWDQVLSEIKSTISKPSYDTWIKGTFAKIDDDDTLIVFSNNDFQCDWLQERYKDMIFHAVKAIAGKTYDLEFAVQER